MNLTTSYQLKFTAIAMADRAHAGTRTTFYTVLGKITAIGTTKSTTHVSGLLCIFQILLQLKKFIRQVSLALLSIYTSHSNCQLLYYMCAH